MSADLDRLLRVPGIGPTGARRILSARRTGLLHFEDLQKMGVVLKRAQFFILCGGQMRPGLHFTAETLTRQLQAVEQNALPVSAAPQLSFFDTTE